MALLPTRWANLQAVSLVDSDGLTLAEATAPDLRPMRAIEMEHGQGMALLKIGAILLEADTLAGGRCTAAELELLAKMTLQHFRHRTIASLVLAIKEGVSRTDEAGKVYGKLTWPTVKLWLDDHEAKIMGAVADEHARSVVKNDNLGRNWMDREEHMATGKDRLIDYLRRKLEAKRNDDEKG